MRNSVNSGDKIRDKQKLLTSLAMRPGVSREAQEGRPLGLWKWL
jgi:hypothetical protein